MSLHLWEAVHDADARSDPLFDIDPATIESPPPSLQRVLLAAASLWCRNLTWPTVREIATTAAVAASTSIHAVGSSEQLRHLLVESELLTIDHLALDRVDDGDSTLDAQSWAIRSRIGRLAAIDQSLAILPLLASLLRNDRIISVQAIGGWAHQVFDEWERAAEEAQAAA